MPEPSNGGDFHPDAGDAVSMAPLAREAELDEGAMPSLDEVVARIPGDIRGMLDDLFRAKFTTVRRVPESSLKDAVRTARTAAGAIAADQAGAPPAG